MAPDRLAWRPKVDKFDTPDEDDRHVLAAAVRACADNLCMNNVKDFPPEALASVPIELLTADALLPVRAAAC